MKRIIARLIPAGLIAAALVNLAVLDYRESGRPPAPHAIYGADSTVSGLSAVGTIHSDDLLMLVDVHDTTMAGTGTNKKGTVNQFLGGATSGQLVGVGTGGTATGITVGSGLAIVSGALTASGGGGSGSGTVNSGTSGQLAYYAATGPAVSGASLSSLLDGIGQAQGSVLYRGASGWSALTPGGNGQVLTSGGASANPSWTSVGGTGTVTGVSVATANGFAGSVVNASTTPAITLSTTISGILKGNGSGGVIQGTPGTDYLAPNGSGSALTGITAAQVGADPILAPQSVQTAGFTAAAGNLYPVDCSSASVTATLPTTPADGVRIGIKAVAISGSNVVTIARGGSDVFNKAAGSTSLTLNALYQSVILQYKAAGGIWYVVSADVDSGGYAAGSNITITTSGGVRTIAASGGGGSSLAGVLVNGTALTNSTATVDLGAGGSTLSGNFTIAANRLAAGTTIRIRAGGVYTGNGSAGIGVKLYLDGASGTPIMVPGAGGPTLPTVTALPWSLDATLICHTTGATGTIGGIGNVRYTGSSSGGTSDINGSLKEYPTSGTPTTIDTTASHTINVIGNWNTASSAVSIQMTDLVWWIEG